jgi:Zn finger protein HypA/HybF involved in hydrogenase expression
MREDNSISQEQWEEKIGDIQNYMVLLEALVSERRYLMATRPRTLLEKAEIWIAIHPARAAAKIMQALVDEVGRLRAGGEVEAYLERKCPLCGSYKVVIFTEDDDICQACGKYFPVQP